MAGLLEYGEYMPAMMEVLIRRYRQNLLLYGPKGSGRHSVLRRLIKNSAAGRVPAIFAGRTFVEFSVEVFLGGVSRASWCAVSTCCPYTSTATRASCWSRTGCIHGWAARTRCWRISSSACWA